MLQVKTTKNPFFSIPKIDKYIFFNIEIDVDEDTAGQKF